MSLRAGAAAVDIRPDRPMALFGYPHVQRVSTGVHDPIMASALYLRTGSSATLLVGLDILFISPSLAKEIRGNIARRLGIEESGVFVSTTHTHSGPVTGKLLLWQDDPAVPDPDEAYLAELAEKAVAAAEAAMADAVEAELAWTTADATGVGGNRLSRDGIIDPESGILTVRRISDQSLIGVSVVYSMHPTVMHEDSTLISSDFPHYMRACVHEQFAEVPVLYHMGPSGNQSPRYFVNGQTFAEAERLGRKLGNAVCAAIATLSDSDYSSDVELKSFLSEVDLPRRTIPAVAEAEKTLAEYRATFERLQAENAPAPEVRTAECAIFGAEGVLTAARANERGEVDAAIESCRPFQVQLLKIGSAWMVGFPGEIFTDYGIALKRQAPEKAFVASLVGGDILSYIVTPEAAAEGGYEAAGSLYEPEAGTILVNAALAVIREHGA